MEVGREAQTSRDVALRVEIAVLFHPDRGDRWIDPNEATLALIERGPDLARVRNGANDVDVNAGIVRAGRTSGTPLANLYRHVVISP
ncbi:hypothetical protein HKCCSP123_05225 [Rhodobacterales bacterium HKCCSP123]|nr:hypothetical protein [Rhodobacterales bacterium HKCCSP123]